VNSAFEPPLKTVSRFSSTTKGWHASLTENILYSKRVFATGHDMQCNGETVKESVKNLDQALQAVVNITTAGSGAVGLAVDEGMHKSSTVDDVTPAAKPNCPP